MLLSRIRKSIALVLVLSLVLSLVHASPGYATPEGGEDVFYENVYAAPDPWDLRNFIQEVEVFDSSGDTPVLLDPWSDTLQMGNIYTFLIKFGEDPYLQFQYNSDGVLVYELPNGLRLVSADGWTPNCYPEANAYVDADPYTGLITVQFDGILEYVSQPELDNNQATDTEQTTADDENREEPADNDNETVTDNEEATTNDEESIAAGEETAAENTDSSDMNNTPTATEAEEEPTHRQIYLEQYINYIDYATDMCFILRLVVELTEEDYFLDFGNGFTMFPLTDEYGNGMPEDGFIGIMPLLAVTSSNLADFITSVNMFDMNGNPISPSTPTFIGQNYKFEITFAESPTLQLAYDLLTGHLLYQLPPYLTIQNAIDVTPLYSPTNSSIIIGWYTIDTNGLVQMWFDNVDLNGNQVGVNFIDYYSNVTIALDIFAQLTDVPDGNIDFGNDIIITIIPPGPTAPSLTMHKASRYVPNIPAGANPATWFERVYYMITITALDGPITNIRLTDIPTLNTNLTFNDPLPPSALSAFSGFTYEITPVVGPIGGLMPMTPITWSASPLSFEYTFIDPVTLLPIVLDPGDFITVRYMVNIPQLIANNNGTGQPLAGMSEFIHNFTINNNATVGGTPIYTGPAVPPVSDNTTDHINKSLAFSKNGVINPGNDSITWTITVGDGVSIPLNGGTITDTINAGAIILPPDSEIQLDFYDGAGVVHSYFADSFYPSLGYYTRVSDSQFTLEVPPSPFTPIYKVVIIYTTPIIPPQQGEPVEVFGNNAYFQFPDGTGNYPGINVTVPVRPAPVIVSKTTSGICGSPDNTTPDQRYWVDYTITVDVPDGLQGEPLYLYDTLGLFPGGSAVPNVPVPIPGYALVTVVPNASETGVSFSYTSPIPYGASGNAWQMFFGAGSAVPGASYWPFDLAATLTVSYRIYLTDAIVATLSNPSTSHYITNSIYLINSDGAPNTGSLGNSVGSTNVTDYWPILKHVQATNNPALFNYTVTIKGRYSARTAPLLQGGNPVFSDTFDPRLAYVPGSFYVVDTGIAGRYFAPANDVIVSGNSFSTNLNSIDWQEFQGTFPTGALVGSAPTSWFAQHRDFTVHYQLHVTDTTMPQSNMVNTARITVNPGACAFESSQTVSFNTQNISKSMTPVQPGSNRLNVEIIINPDGEVIFSDGINPGPAQITAVDNLVNLMMFTDSIQIFTQTLVNGVWDGTWVQVPFTFNDRQLWSVNITPQANVPTGVSSQVQFVLPNQTPIKIDYVVGVTLPPGTPGNISNEISIFGDGDSSNQGNYVVGGGGAGVDADMLDLRVFKQDAVGNNLMGATFDLYVTIIGSYQPPGELTVDKTITGAGGTVLNFGLIGEVTTDATGMALFSEEQWITPDPRFYLLYMLVETQAPVGYEPIYENIFFTLNPMITASQIANLNALLAPVLLPGEAVNQISDFITVTNIPSNLQPGSLRIQKVFDGLTNAQIQANLSNFQLVITDPNMVQRIFSLADVLNPNGIVLQNITAGMYIFEERNATVPNYTLTTAPHLPARRYIMPNDAGEVVVTIVNTYTPYPNLTLRKAFYIDDIASDGPPAGASLISFLIIGTDANGNQIFRATINYSDFVNGTYTLNNLPPGMYVIYETGGWAEGFRFYTGGLLGLVPLMPGVDVTIPINNAYSTIPPDQINPGLLVRKAFHGLSPDEYPPDFKITVTGGSPIQTWEFGLADIIAGNAFIPDIPEGTYIITESGYDVPGFNVQLPNPYPIRIIVMPDDVAREILVVLDNIYVKPPPPPIVPPIEPPIPPIPPIWPPPEPPSPPYIPWTPIPPTTHPPTEPPITPPTSPPTEPPVWPPPYPPLPPPSWPPAPPSDAPHGPTGLNQPSDDSAQPPGDLGQTPDNSTSPRHNPQTGDSRQTTSCIIILLMGFAIICAASEYKIRRTKSSK